MQKISGFKTALLATLALGAVSSIVPPAEAATLFSQREVNPSSFIAVASPYARGTAHQLLIIEQLSSARQCWSENPGSPTIVNPLLLNFDFSGICGRSIDGNGYSIRMGGQDLGLRYGLRVQKRGNDLMLVGVPFDRKSPELLIAHTNGITADSAKFSFYPGWRLTKRAYNGQTLGHVYLTNDQPVSTVVAAAPTPPKLPVTPVRPPATRPSTPIAVPKPSTSRSIPIAVPKPDSTPIQLPRPAAPVTIGVPQPSRGDYVVPTIEVNY
jgi:Protein of unknown function (DUF3747)